MNKMRMLEQNEDDAADVTWGTLSSRVFALWLIWILEDQQRINSFSKLNTRLRTLEDKLEEIKVRTARLTWAITNTISSNKKRPWTIYRLNWSSQTRMTLYCTSPLDGNRHYLDIS